MTPPPPFRQSIDIADLSRIRRHVPIPWLISVFRCVFALPVYNIYIRLKSKGDYCMITVKAYYDGAAFVPVEPIDIVKGKFVELTVLREEDTDSEIAKRLSAFARITNNIREINKTDPLPPEFDAILAKRVNFTGGLDL
jgi:hypothetical protein